MTEEDVLNVEDDYEDEANVLDDEPSHNATVVIQPTNRHPANQS